MLKKLKIMKTKAKPDFTLFYYDAFNDSINTVTLFACTRAEAMRYASGWCRLAKVTFVGLFDSSFSKKISFITSNK